MVINSIVPKGEAVFIVCEGLIYLMKRCENAASLPGQWSQHGGGHEEQDLSPLNAIIRETYEETGHVFEPSRFVPLGISRFGTVFFILQALPEEAHNLQCLEGEIASWFKFSELSELESFRLRQTAIAYFYAAYPQVVKKMMEEKPVFPEDFGLSPYIYTV